MVVTDDAASNLRITDRQSRGSAFGTVECQSLEFFTESSILTEVREVKASESAGYRVLQKHRVAA